MALIRVSSHPMSQLPFYALLPALTVSELTHYLRQLLDGDEMLQDIWVQGEVSNFSRPSSGHLYFTIKDSGASLRCVMWRNNALKQAYLPGEGDAVKAHGYISIYEAGGQYQLYADLLRPAGEGELYQEFLRLKARLEAEGLFESSRKRPIPPLPKCIGIVTSPTAAALRDMLNTLRRRYPLAEVVLAPTPVQGDEAPLSIVTALQNINRLAKPDVILLARGGGSIEDLWAFNDERVARAIFTSQAPVITGIGHETDFTIADFVADLRAPTPTAAAELATPDQLDLRASLDDLEQHLSRVAQAAIHTHRWAFADLRSRLELHSPRFRLQTDRQRLDEAARRASSALYHRLQLAKAGLVGLDQRLSALSPQAVLERGYAIITNPAGQVVHSIHQAIHGERLNAHVSDGDFAARVEKA